MNTAGINGARLNSFTEIFYHDWRNDERDPLLDERYIDFQLVSSEKHPGYKIAPVMVDVMFEILSINERKIQDSLNITDSKSQQDSSNSLFLKISYMI